MKASQEKSESRIPKAEGNPKSEARRPRPPIASHKFRILSAAVVLSLGAQMTVAGTNSAPTATIANGTPRSAPAWATRLQNRTNLNQPALLRAANTNWSSLARVKAALPGRSANQKMVPAQVGPNHRTWKAEPDDLGFASTNTVGQGVPPVRAVGKVVAIASGMNYWDGQQWSPSDASFDLTDEAFVANRVQHRTRLNADLNVVGAVTTTLLDGTTLRSTPVAIALYDPNDGRFAVVSTLTNSVGVLVDSNRVVYPEAFQGGVCASVVYTLQKGSFEH